MAGRLHLKVQGSNKRNPCIHPRRIDYMNNQGLASSLHGRFPIKIRQNNLLTTYKSSRSTIAQPSLTTLVHVPPQLMHCYHFRRENYISPSFHFSIFFSLSFWWLFISANQGWVIFSIFVIATSTIWSLFALRICQCFLRSRFCTRVIAITKGCIKIDMTIGRSIEEKKQWLAYKSHVVMHSPKLT